VVVLAGASGTGPAAADEHVTLRPVGYVQADTRAFPEWGVDLADGLRSDGFDLRHLRGGLRFESPRLAAQAVVDVAGFANDWLGDDVSPRFIPRQRFKDMYVEVQVQGRHGLRVGHFKVPLSREFLVPEQRTDFIERSLFSSGLAPGRDWGAMLQGRVDVAYGLGYQVGAFSGDNWADASRARETAAGRVWLEPFKGLQVALSGSFGRARSKGLQGRSASGWVFFRRPDVQGERRRLGADVQYVRGRVRWTAEILTSREEGRGVAGQEASPVSAAGGSLTLVWRVPFLARPFELSTRYDGLRLRAGAAPAAAAQALTAGILYEPRAWLRFMGNGVLDHYGPAALAPASDRATYVTLLARVQLAFP
jgi:hypothetical protein